MPHSRKRHALPLLQKLRSFWPVTGVIGLRQVGKSTLLRDQSGDLKTSVSLDDEESRAAADASAKAFLAKLAEPALIDEVQKVPKLFDAIKYSVDRERKPNRFLLTGSVEFSSRVGIRESLTGRIGLLRLYPFTLAEMHNKKFDVARQNPLHSLGPRFSVEEFSRYTQTGGMPVPSFMRDRAQRDLYFTSWIETTLLRDVSRAYGRNYDPDFAERVLADLVRVHREGEFPSLAALRMPARKITRYLQAFQDVFLINRVTCEDVGIGRDAYFLADAGLATYLMGSTLSPEAALNLTRITVINELLAVHAYQGKRWAPRYYKSSRGAPIDLVWDGIPIQILYASRTNQWNERALRAAMKKLGAKRGFLAAGVDTPRIETKGISIVPWSHWS